MNFNRLFSLTRSLFINLKLFGWGGKRCPLIISNHIKIKGLKRGSITISTSLKTGAISIGFGGSKGIYSSQKGYLIFGENGRIHFAGKASFGEGISIRIDSGLLEIGDNFSCNKNCFISCTDSIKIGEDSLWGWNVNIRDSDGHKIKHSDGAKLNLKPVIIGNHVWIASYVDVLKGAIIPDHSVIGYRSCVTEAFHESHCLIGGYPARILQKEIDWEK